MKRMYIFFLATVVIILLIVGGFVVWRFTLDKSPEVNKICNHLLFNDGPAFFNYHVITYTNVMGEVEGYMANNPKLDGGSSHHFDAGGNLIGVWGLMQSPESQPLINKWSKIRTASATVTRDSCIKRGTLSR